MIIDGDGRLTNDPRDPQWSQWAGAVLLSNEIEYYANDPAIPDEQKLIFPFEPLQLEAARYNLRLGAEYRKNAEPCTLSDKEPWLTIEPFQMALVETFEQIRLPRFLIARWNLKVPVVYRGLLWVGALQVDPGWQGHLACPIYNLSDKEVRVKYKDELFAMDFVRTTPYVQSSKAYVQKTGFGNIGSVHNYDQVGLKSGPYELGQEIERIQESNRQFQARFETNLGVLIGIITLVVAAMVVLVGVSLENSTGFDLKNINKADVALVLAAVAILASSAHLLTRVVGVFWLRKRRR